MADVFLHWSDDNLKVPIRVVGGQINSGLVSVDLVGNGYVNWGQTLEQNLIRLLEHFASNIAPPAPTIGQVWYDTGHNQFKVYTVHKNWGVIWEAAANFNDSFVWVNNDGDEITWVNNSKQQIFFGVYS